jgi:heme exporter protein A
LLSSGQRKRAALARVVGSVAPLWLLDEPYNALDSDGAGRLEALISQHLAQGGALLAASHQPIAGIARTLDLGQ